MRTGLIIFIKNPLIGKVKTRLAKTLGDEKALEIYQQLLLHTVQITKNINCDKFVYYSDFVDQNDSWNNDRYFKKLQSGGNLGDRMSAAFMELFKSGYNKLIIIGSDCLELTELEIINAFEVLNNDDVVIGPSFDGGYYLLGMKAFLPTLFMNKNWSTPTVFKDTLHDLNELNKTVSKLITLNDIDEEKDLPVLHQYSHSL